MRIEAPGSNVQGKDPVLIAGVFNAWAIDLGSKRTNAKGRVAHESLSSIDMTILNADSEYTLNGDGRLSAIGIAMTWGINNVHNHCDH